MIYLPKPTRPVLPVSVELAVDMYVLTLVIDPSPRKDSLVMLLSTSWVVANDRLVKSVRFWNMPAGISSRGLSFRINMVVLVGKVRLLRSVIPWLARFSSEAVACFIRNPQLIIRISLNPRAAILCFRFSSICKLINLTGCHRAKCHFHSYRERLLLTMVNFHTGFLMCLLVSQLKAN